MYQNIIKPTIIEVILQKVEIIKAREKLICKVIEYIIPSIMKTSASPIIIAAILSCIIFGMKYHNQGRVANDAIKPERNTLTQLISTGFV